MSEYTREEILKLIEENGGPEGLDLSGKDLSDIDLSREAIAAELEKRGISDVNDFPVWARAVDGRLRGINLPLVNLREAKLAGAKLQGAFLWRANLKKAGLQGADLQKTVLGEADLQETSLWRANLQEADLVETNLQKADLRHAKIQKAQLYGANLFKANLGEADLQEADLQNARLQSANLVSANLQEADLKGADLRGAYLGGTDLQGVSLMGADLQGANLVEANLKGADLRYSHLEKVDFFSAKSLGGAYFYNAFLDDTRMRREQLGGAIGEELVERYDEAKEAYLALKNNFAEIGRYRDESWAYVKERRMGKMMHHPRLARKYYEEELPENPNVWQLGWFYTRHTAKWTLDWVVEWTCGYGESVLRTLRAMGVALVGFAVLYWLLGAVVDVSGNPSSTWLHCLLYSGGAFTTFGVDTLRPANDWIRALSILESVVGIALTGLLGFVLGNRIRRS